jgi:hypothetical protein
MLRLIKTVYCNYEYLIHALCQGGSGLILGIIVQKYKYNESGKTISAKPYEKTIACSFSVVDANPYIMRLCMKTDFPASKKLHPFPFLPGRPHVP